MAITDRRGVAVSATDAAISGDPNPGLAWKAPVRVATTANIVLSGLQTIDGIALAAGDRVLVKSQTDQKTNGIYNAATSSWTRAIDANNSSQFAHGLQVFVTSGSTNGGNDFDLTTADPIVLGTSNLTWASASGATTSVATTAPLAGGGTLSPSITITLNYDGVTLVKSGSTLEAGAGSGDVTWSAGSFVTTIGSNVVSYAKFQQVAAVSLVGNPTGSLANASEITLGSTLTFSGTALQTLGLTGDVTASANSFVTTIASNVVSYAKFQQVAAVSLVGNPTGSLANAEEITLDSTLAFSGTTLKLSTTGVSAATYGDSSHIPQIAIDANGRITSASNVAAAASGANFKDFMAFATGIV